MALQLVYTSAPKLLDAGRSGFGVVARSKNLPPLAANAIERFSKFANMQGTNRSRIVMAHRKVTIGSTRLHVLSRIRDSGSDHTGRTNHIAHHLVFSPQEIRQAIAQRITPADVFEQSAWFDRWEGAPKTFEDSTDARIGNLHPNFANSNRASWAAVTGEPMHSRLLAWDGAPKTGTLIIPENVGILGLLGEALAECTNPWEKTFTTSLEPTDELAELDWVIASKSDASSISRTSSRAVFDITRPLDLPVPSEAPQVHPIGIDNNLSNDVHAHAEDLAMSKGVQERVLPPPDVARHRPLNVRTIPAHVRGHMTTDNRPANVPTRTERDGKLWLIIGGGVAALFIVVATVLFLSMANKGSEERRTQIALETRQNDERKELIERLKKAGERQDHAEKIAGLNIDDAALKALPDEISKITRGMKNLGSKLSTDQDIDKKLIEFENETKGIADLKILPSGSMSHSLWHCLSWIKMLRDESDTTRPAQELIGELKVSLDRLRNQSPDQFNESEIRQIYTVLWNWKYRRITQNLVDGKKSIKAADVIEFVDVRDQQIITDEVIKAIHKKFDEAKQIAYMKKMKEIDGSDLWQMLVKHFPRNETPKEQSDVVQSKFEPEENQKPEKAKVLSESAKLKNEEWCVVNPHKNGKFSLDLPKSKVIQSIMNKSDQDEVFYSFTSDDKNKLGDFNARPQISIDNNIISHNGKIPDRALEHGLTIKYQDAELKLHFAKWPDSAVKNNELMYSMKRVLKENKSSHSHLYEITIVGKTLEQLYDLRSKTIPVAEIYLVKEGREIRIEKKGDSISYIMHPTDPENEKPTPPVRKMILAILAKVDAETKKKTDELNEKSNDDKKKSDVKVGDYEKIWKEHGLDALNKPDAEDALFWLNTWLKAHSYNIGQIKKIGGDLSPVEKKFVELIRDPKGVFHEPKIPPQIGLGLRVDQSIVFNRAFTLKNKSK